MKKMKWLYVLLATFLLTSCGTLMQPYQMDSKMKDIELGMTKKKVISILGIAGTVASLLVESVFVSAICGVFAFSSFWTIKEVFEQEERVLKGWFPKNPKRTYPEQKP